jgi:hypothetical protein
MKINTQERTIDYQGEDQLTLIKAEYGGELILKQKTELITLSGGAGTYTATAFIPAGTILLALEGYVETILAGASLNTWDLGDGSDDDRFAAAKALIVGTTFGIADATGTKYPMVCTAAQDLVFTANAGVISSGAVRIAAYYLELASLIG